MDLTKKQLAGVIGLITILAGFGGTQLVPIEHSNMYVCPLTEQIGVFDRLSASGKTGYYTINGTEYAVRCRKGNVYDSWISIDDYAKLHGVILQTPTISRDYTTSPDGKTCYIHGDLRLRGEIINGLCKA